jgi:hypothetical protein
MRDNDNRREILSSLVCFENIKEGITEEKIIVEFFRFLNFVGALLSIDTHISNCSDGAIIRINDNGLYDLSV